MASARSLVLRNDPLGVPPQQQMLFDAECCTHVRQPAIAHQLGPQVGTAHRQIGVVAINEFGGGEPQLITRLQPFRLRARPLDTWVRA